MTRDEIMAMTLEQLRIAIAEAKGWTFWTSSRAEIAVAMPGIDPPYSPEYRTMVNDTQNYRISWDGSNWTKDISYTWMLLEELRQAFFSTNIIMWDHSDTVYVICHPRQGHGENLPDLEAIGDDVKIAACRAWLMWKATA